MKKTMKKIAIIALMMLVLSFGQNISVFAFDWKTELENHATAQTEGEGTEVVSAVENIGGSIVTIARVICVGIAIIMLVVLAMKYMTSAPGDKATIKKHAVVYIVGAIVMFASSGILGIIADFAGVLE